MRTWAPLVCAVAIACGAFSAGVAFVTRKPVLPFLVGSGLGGLIFLALIAVLLHWGTRRD